MKEIRIATGYKICISWKDNEIETHICHPHKGFICKFKIILNFTCLKKKSKVSMSYFIIHNYDWYGN